MFKAWFNKREIEGKFKIWAPDLEAKITDKERLKQDLEWELESRVKAEILKFVETEIDKEICRKLAQDFLKDFNYKPILEKAMLEKFEGYVKGTVAPPMYVDLSQQAMLAQRRY